MINKDSTESIHNPERFLGKLSLDLVNKAIAEAVKKVEHNIIELGETFPTSSTVNGSYASSKNVEWTTGFWTGILWLCYENTGNDEFKKLAEKNVISFKKRIDNKIDVNNHDLGFMYIPSCVAAYKLTGNKIAKQAALEAADQLANRYNPLGRFIQAWGNKGAANNYRLIVDALMNIPLLQWASRETNNDKYAQIANNHFETTLKYAVRTNGSAYHTFFFDNKTGSPLGGKTRQGYSDDSSWARGQAWLIYGTALNYRYLRTKEVASNYEAVTNYFLNRLPKDYVTYWDLIFSDGSYQAKDSSSAAIAVCGMDEMSHLKPELKENSIYLNAQNIILKSLIENYTKQESQGIIPLINHGVYSWHSGHGIDEGTIWGDYYYLEALTRFKNKSWRSYW